MKVLDLSAEEISLVFDINNHITLTNGKNNKEKSTLVTQDFLLIDFQ